MSVPMLKGGRILNSAVFGAIVMTLAAKLELMRRLRFLERVPIVNARDDELMGRYTGTILSADVVADGAKAAVYEAGQLELVTTALANVKIGRRLTQGDLQRMQELSGRQLTESATNEMADFENGLAENVVTGVRQMQNALVAGMMIDSVAVDRLGVKATGSFGMPSDLKSTPSNAWSDATNGTPIADIQALRDTAADTYGKEYNRLTMSRKTFSAITKTAEFKAKVTTLLGFAAAAAAINTGDRMGAESAVSRLLDGMTLEIDDATIARQSDAGVITRSRVLPIGTVLLSNSNDDGDPTVMDLGNAIVTESIVAELMGNAPKGLGGRVFGPIGYYDGSLNPPSAIAWAVARCWPRKHQPEATAVINTGVT